MMITARTHNEMQKDLILSELESAKFISAEEELDGGLGWVEGGDTEWAPGGPLIGQVRDLHRRPIPALGRRRGGGGGGRGGEVEEE